MIVNIKNQNIFSNVRNNVNFEFSDFERFNRVLSFLELPFFFDNELSNFYRFEASAYNFNYELIYRNFSVDLNLGLKVKTKLLMSMFMKLPSNKFLFDKKFSSRSTFLLNNGFFKSSKNLLKKNDIKVNNDYFNTSLNTRYIKTFYNISYELSDISLDVLSSYNKFNRVSNINMYDIDTFISTFNSNWFSFHNDNYAVSNLVVVNDNLRTFSFLVSSLDRFKLMHPKYFVKYLYFKKVINKLRNNKYLNLFNLLFNANYYIYIYNYLYKKIDIFFFKNLNYINNFNYIYKFILYLIINNFNLIINNNILFKFIYINYFSSLFSKNYYIFNNIFIKKLKIFLILLNNNSTIILNKILIFNNKNSLKRSISKFYHNIKFSHFFNNRYSLLTRLNNKKCYHAYSIHYQPSEIFYAASRLGYTFSAILFTTNFKNLKGSFYNHKAVFQYYGFLKFFSDFILSFLKLNFIKSILHNFYYNPKYLFYKYFTVFKLIFPLIFKKWALKKINYNYKNLSLSLNFLNFLLLNKSNKLLKKKTKKIVVNKNLVYGKKVRFYSTNIIVKDTSESNYSDFFMILNFFFIDLLKNINYLDLIFILPRYHDWYKVINNSISNYFYFLIFSLYSKFNLFSFFFNISVSINNLYFFDYKFLAVVELINSKLNINLFYKIIFPTIVRFSNFILKIDFYTFIILKRFVEYFRIFKYNEYIINNKLNLVTYFSQNHYIENFPDFSFLPSFYSFKKALFFNKYLIYKMYTLKVNSKKKDKNFYSSVLLNSIFFKFFLLYFSVKKIFKIFSLFFLFYLNNSLYLYIYKSLINSKSFLQKISIKRLDDLYMYPQILSYFTNNYMYSQLKIILFNDLNLISYNYFKTLDFSLNNLSLYTNFIIILLNDYVDEFFYMYLLNFEDLKYNETLSFIKSMLTRSAFNFINIKYTLNISLLNFSLFKQHIDLLIWQIYNTAFVSTYNSSYLNDIYFFIQKLDLDNIFRFQSNNIDILFTNLRLNFNNLLNYFLIFIFLKDFFFKFLEKFFLFIYFFNSSLFFQYKFYLKLLQFNNLFLAQSKFYYFNDYMLFLKMNKFNYFL